MGVCLVLHGNCRRGNDNESRWLARIREWEGQGRAGQDCAMGKMAEWDWGYAAPRLRSLNRTPLTILVGAAIKRFGFHAIAYFGISQNPDRVVGVFAQILDGDVLIC